MTRLYELGYSISIPFGNANKYDLIILEDNLEPDSAYSILKELEKDSKFSIPVLIAISDEKVSIKKNLVEDGFTDILEIDHLEDEVKRISEKYL